jgi:TetR/AcrR family transcriptional repressor of nem operon
MVNAATERMAVDVSVATRVRDTVSAMEEALTAALRAAQDAGQVATDRSARDLARFLVLTVQGLRVMGVIEPDRRALRASVEVALRCLD